MDTLRQALKTACFGDKIEVVLDTLLDTPVFGVYGGIASAVSLRYFEVSPQFCAQNKWPIQEGAMYERLKALALPLITIIAVLLACGESETSSPNPTLSRLVFIFWN